MADKPSRSPLAWPVGWKRITSRVPGPFGTMSTSVNGGWRSRDQLTIGGAIKRLVLELERMGVAERDIVISSNLKLRNDGLPYSDQRMPADPGVAVYWKDRKGRDRCMAIDRYTKVEQNIAALAASLEALRAVERHGGAAIIDRAFTGFTALPAPIVAGMHRPWREVLEVGRNETMDEDYVQTIYRRLASIHHPDRGGSAEKMAELNRARDEALQEIKQ